MSSATRGVPRAPPKTARVRSCFPASHSLPTLTPRCARCPAAPFGLGIRLWTSSVPPASGIWSQSTLATLTLLNAASTAVSCSALRTSEDRSARLLAPLYARSARWGSGCPHRQGLWLYDEGAHRGSAGEGIVPTQRLAGLPTVPRWLGPRGCAHRPCHPGRAGREPYTLKMTKARGRWSPRPRLSKVTVSSRGVPYTLTGCPCRGGPRPRTRALTARGTRGSPG